MSEDTYSMLSSSQGPSSGLGGSAAPSSQSSMPMPGGGSLPGQSQSQPQQQQNQQHQQNPHQQQAECHNPYLGRRDLTSQEAQLLGEYHRLAQTLKRILALSSPLSATRPHAQVLDSMRSTERKMGLVITLFKASVWNIMVEQDERERVREEARRMLEEEQEQHEGGGAGGRRQYDGQGQDDDQDGTVMY
ncbi:unnamed protein product [Jaminaea pallidilutea]